MQLSSKTGLALAALAAVSLAAAQPAAAQTVLTFEDLTGQAPLPSNYHGLTWTDWEYYDFAQPPFTPHSGVERIYAADPNGANLSTGSFSFAAPTVFDGAWFSGISTTSVTFSLFDASNTLVDTATLASLSDTPTFLSSGYGGLVTSVTVTGTDASYVMDDVTFGAPAVPEASTTVSFGLLLAFGMGGLVIVAKRRKTPV